MKGYSNYQAMPGITVYYIDYFGNKTLFSKMKRYVPYVVYSIEYISATILETKDERRLFVQGAVVQHVVPECISTSDEPMKSSAL